MRKINLELEFIKLKTKKPIISKNERVDLLRAFNLMKNSFNVEYDPSCQIQQVILRFGNITCLLFSTGNIRIVGKTDIDSAELLIEDLYKKYLKECIIKKTEKRKLNKADIKRLKDYVKKSKKLITSLEEI